MESLKSIRFKNKLESIFERSYENIKFTDENLL